MTRKNLILAGIALAFTGIAVAGAFDRQDVEASHANYCEGVAVWMAEADRGIRPEHRTGHPDYHGTAADYCPGLRPAR